MTVNLGITCSPADVRPMIAFIIAQLHAERNKIFILLRSPGSKEKGWGVPPPNPCAVHFGPAASPPLLRDRAQSQQNNAFVSFCSLVPPF